MKPYYEDGLVAIYHADWRDVDVQVDVTVTDPPYGTGGWRRGASGAGSDPKASLIVEDWDDGATDWLRLQPTISFWPSAHAMRLLTAANAIGLTKHRALYMRKRDPKPQVSGRIRWAVEPIWVLSADGFLLYGGDDIFEASTPRLGRDANATGHPYEKPLEVMRWLLGKLEGSPAVLDPFMGSGTTLRAAKDLGLRAVGIEADERWCEVAAGRCAQEVLDFEGGIAA